MNSSPLRTIPAIDLLGGRVVRLYQGDYSRVSVYYEDPGQPASSFVEDGADLIHVVDLDAARSGDRKINRQAIAKVMEKVADRAAIQLGGGIRSLEALSSYFESGVTRCILGTAALQDFNFLESALQNFGAERIIVAIDVRDGRAHVSGWESSEEIALESLFHSLQERGVEEVVFTDISRDGALSGPGRLLYQYMEACKLRFILSGGVSSLEDLRQILKERPQQLVGAIVGRALYEKCFSLREALLLCREEHDPSGGA